MHLFQVGQAIVFLWPAGLEGGKIRSPSSRRLVARYSSVDPILQSNQPKVIIKFYQPRQRNANALKGFVKEVAVPKSELGKIATPGQLNRWACTLSQEAVKKSALKSVPP